jgi:hypothetical protein
MSDTTKCTNSLCPLSNECLRYTLIIINVYWQSYCFFLPSVDEKTGDVDCDYYIPIPDLINPATA